MYHEFNQEVQGAPEGHYQQRPRGGDFTVTAVEVRLPTTKDFRKGEAYTLQLMKYGEDSNPWRGQPATVQDAEEALTEVLAFAAELAGEQVPAYTLRPETLLDYHLAWAMLQCVDEIRILLGFAPKAVELTPKSVKEKGKQLAQNVLGTAATYLGADIKRQKPPVFEGAILGLQKFITEVLTRVYGETRLSSLRNSEGQYYLCCGKE
jgi:hypothetical protein